MSELRSVVESLRSEVLAELPDARIEEDFCELHRSIEQLEAERLRRLAEIDRRRLFERDGYLSAASWLANRFKVGWGQARLGVRVARALEQMPLARRALEEGEISLSAVRALVAARDEDPEAFQGAEEHLVDAAKIHSTHDLSKVVAYWRQAVEREQSLRGEDKLLERRRLYASTTFLGMVRVDGDLDPENGESLLTAIRAVLDAEARSGPDDHRTPAQQRADALGEICRQWLDLVKRPQVAGERPHVTLTVDARVIAAFADTERSGGGGSPRSGEAESPREAPCELDHTGPVHPGLAKQIACDASVMRVVLAGRSEPLDVGRRTPVIPPAMRRAVIVRDRRCRFPGCDRPHTWCDAHHVVHWADGGPTALPNLVLLCRRHHRMVHRPGGFRLELEDGRPVFRRPDGSVLGYAGQDRAPP
ncbi:MAG: DUF222 domain-containing protein [Candidatus Velamenicoccus archaeovorus]